MLGRFPWRLVFSVQCVLLAVLLAASTASAAGRLVWKKTNIKESSESWRIEVEFHLNRAPDFAHVPVQFKFEPLSYFERALVDGNDEPQLRRVPLQGKAPLIETVDVGFLDPGTGKVQKRTRFSFKLTRARGFEAGEYSVKVSFKRTGQNLGGATRITLDGENEVIDRRSISFDAKPKKKKKQDTGSSSESAYDPKQDPDNDAYWAGGPQEPEATGDKSLPPPAHLQEKPGGCGCRALGANATAPARRGGFWLLGLLVVAAWTGRGVRRRHE